MSEGFRNLNKLALREWDLPDECVRIKVLKTQLGAQGFSGPFELCTANHAKAIDGRIGNKNVGGYCQIWQEGEFLKYRHNAKPRCMSRRLNRRNFTVNFDCA